MHVLVDALSVNNLSGRHVLAGHLRELAAQAAGNRYTLLTSAANDGMFAELPAGVSRHRAAVGSGWLNRVAWLRLQGRALCATLQVDAVFSPSGMLSVGLPRPQVVLAQNPWPLLARQEGPAGALKSALQRRAFAGAQQRAAVMAFNSVYMRDLYARHFGERERDFVVAHQGIEERLFELGGAVPEREAREPIVLCVSVMARHKAVEVLVAAFQRVLAQQPEARLHLVGGWPDAAYRHEIEALASTTALAGRVHFTGHVDEAELHALYRRARVFCLPSRCESFGIPAVEAQAFGTPAVVASGTAAPEIVGRGGIGVPQDDAGATAEALVRLLGDELEWRQWSVAARENAGRFHWQACSAPLVSAFARLASSRG
jgi:glycosyltransferase involved in cell wall biosynthesis